VVFSGHDHFYERIKPQQGIYYFVCGAGGSLRKGDIDRRTGLTEVGFDADYSFMMVEIDGSDMYFQAVSRTGQTVDSGVIKQAAGRGVVKASPVPPGEPVAPAAVPAKPVAQPTPTPPPGAAPMDTTTPQVVATPKPSPSPSPSPTPKPPVRKRRPVKKPN
jgi:hypothetical protein